MGRTNKTMTDSQKIHLTLSEKDRRGNPVTPATVPVWSSSNTEVVSVEPSDDGLECDALAVGPLGEADVSVAADGLSGGPLTLTIVSGAAVNVDINAGEPTEQ